MSMKPYHNLLIRQIKKTVSDPEKVASEFRALLDLVSDAYQHFENDRTLLERSIDLSSKELTQVNERMLKEKQLGLKSAKPTK